jgi:hypothetical protein
MVRGSSHVPLRTAASDPRCVAAQTSCSDGSTNGTQAACEQSNGNSWAVTCLFSCTPPGSTACTGDGIPLGCTDANTNANANGSPTSDADAYSACVDLGNAWSPSCNFLCTGSGGFPKFISPPGGLSGADLSAAPTVCHRLPYPTYIPWNDATANNRATCLLQMGADGYTPADALYSQAACMACSITSPCTATGLTWTANPSEPTPEPTPMLAPAASGASCKFLNALRLPSKAQMRHLSLAGI